MAAMGNINPKTLLEGSVIFEAFKGALSEQYVLHQLKSMPEMSIHYWSAENIEKQGVSLFYLTIFYGYPCS